MKILICTKCKKEKTYDNFSIRKESSTGFRRTCKKCTLEVINKYSRERYKNDEEYRKEYNLRKSKWRKEHKYNCYQPQTEKRRCYDKIKNALRYKKIQKKENCEYCDKKIKLVAHHYDYKKPLDVFWLCNQCHRDIHRRVKDFYNIEVSI